LCVYELCVCMIKKPIFEFEVLNMNSYFLVLFKIYMFEYKIMIQIMKIILKY